VLTLCLLNLSENVLGYLQQSTLPMYLPGRGKLSELINKFLHEVLDLTPAIILLLGELPQQIILYFIMEWRAVIA
jgi:hypothetical protein